VKTVVDAQEENPVLECSLNSNQLQKDNILIQNGKSVNLTGYNKLCAM